MEEKIKMDYDKHDRLKVCLWIHMKSFVLLYWKEVYFDLPVREQFRAKFVEFTILYNQVEILFFGWNPCLMNERTLYSQSLYPHLCQESFYISHYFFM